MSRYRTRVKPDVPSVTLIGRRATGVVDRSRVSFVSRQQTWDEEHIWHHYRRWMRNPAQAGFFSHVHDVGGDFTTRTDYPTFESTPVVDIGSTQGHRFSGHLLPARPSAYALRADVPVVPIPGVNEISYDSKYDQNGWPVVSITDEQELGILGAKLLSSLAPDAPHNSVYTSLGEIKNDGLPSIPFLSFLKDGKLPEKVGGEWLNYQFGIAPTISDVKKITKTVRDAEKLVKQYLRDSGKIVRRRYDMDPVTSTTSGLYSAASSTRVPVGTSTSFWSSIGPVNYTETVTTQRSYSAAYSYYVDQSSLNGALGWLDKTNYLYGWKPDPSAMYNLTAWSWLLDWFTNTGDVIDNISLYLRDPSLVRYAYIMEKKSVTREYTQAVTSYTGGPFIASVRFHTVIKKRRRVNPLYWGLTEDALDARQLSILAALGLTRLRDPGLM